MPTICIREEVHGRVVELGCYGSGKDWVVRMTDPSSQSKQHNDAYHPPPDLGFVWLRESDNKWLASGLVNRAVFKDADTVDDLLHRVMNEVIGRGDQLARCIESTAAELTCTFDGSEEISKARAAGPKRCGASRGHGRSHAVAGGTS
jgi:hypothetical protein